MNLALVSAFEKGKYRIFKEEYRFLIKNRLREQRKEREQRVAE